jgi:hypothetical protein
MRLIIALTVLSVAAWAWTWIYAPKVRHAKWDGQKFSCPVHTDLWANESEALAGKSDYVYCIPGSR